MTPAERGIDACLDLMHAINELAKCNYGSPECIKLLKLIQANANCAISMIARAKKKKEK